MRLFGAKWLFLAIFIGGRCGCGSKGKRPQAPTYTIQPLIHIYKIKLN